MAGDGCVACGGPVDKRVAENQRDYEYGSTWQGAIAGCSRCGLIHQWPMPTREQALSYYPDGYAHYNPDDTWLRAFLMNLYVGRIVKTFLKLGVREGDRLVDIGCSAGEKLNLLRNKMKVEAIGVEPNAYAANKARERYGLEVINSVFPTEEIAPGTVDFIHINHVIEHDPDPVGLLNDIHTALKPGGWVIGETENIDCLSYRVFGEYWSLLHLPYHLLFFTRETLASVFERSRLGSVHLDSVTDAFAWSLSLQNYLRRKRPPGGGKTERMRGYLFVSMVAVPVSWLEMGKGPILRFYAQKPPAD